MTLAWHEHEEALAEYRAAVEWYEDKRAGWGEVFILAVDATIESILDPSIRWGHHRHRPTSPQLYSRSVPGFPYDIIHLRLKDEVIIVAYAHERRRPGYWTRRLPG